MGGFCSLEIHLMTEPRPGFCCHISFKSFLPSDQSCYR